MVYQFYDHSYRDIFSHPEVVRDLVKAFIKADWIEQLDFNSLMPVKDKYVSDRSKVREQDSIWRLKFNHHEWLYLYVFLEFQSSIDRFMAVRFFTYMGMFFEHLIKSKQLVAQHLPPVLPFVIYMGSDLWDAPTCSSELFVPGLPALLKRHLPQFEYHLLDIGRYALDESFSHSSNLLVPLIQFEQSIQRREQVLFIIEAINKKFASKEFDSYRRAMYIYMYKMIGLGKLEPIDITSLEDVTMSLVQERMKIYDQSLIEEGRQEGRQEGRREALASLSLALELRSKGLPMQDIQQKTQLPLELLQTLMKV